MASVRDSAEVKLIGFEQGVNIKTIEQIRNQTRARFHPLAHPKIVLNDKSDKKPSVTLRIKDIPSDPGDGYYNLHIESFKGSAHDLKIRVVDNYQAKTSLKIKNSVTKALFDSGNSGSLHQKAVRLFDSNGNFIILILDFDVSRITRVSADTWRINLNDVDNASNVTVRNGIVSKFYETLNSAYSDGDIAIFPILKFTTDNPSSVHGLSAGQKITIKSADGTLVDYFISDIADGGVNHLSPVAHGATLKSAGSIVASRTANSDRGIAIGLDLSGSKTQTEILSLISEAIINNNGHAGKIGVSTIDNSNISLSSSSGNFNQISIVTNSLSNITNTLDLNQKITGKKGNTSVDGNLISSDYIEVPNFSAGQNGLLRTLNVGDLRHPRDPNSFALGLRDVPGYYVGEFDSRGNDVGGNAVPYNDVINSSPQKIKRITFDLNNIINYNTHKAKSVDVNVRDSFEIAGHAIDTSTGSGNIQFAQALGPKSAASFSFAFPTGTIVRLNDGTNISDLTIGTNSGTNVSFTAAVLISGSTSILVSGIRGESGSINRVFVSSQTGISSRIIQDDTLLITQEVKGVTAVESAIGKKIKQVGLNNSAPPAVAFGLENWKLTSKEVSDFVYHDIFTEARRFDVSERSTDLLFKIPDLSVQISREKFEIKFLEIDYDVLNENIPENPVFPTRSFGKISFFVSNEGDLGGAKRIITSNNGKTTAVFINPFISHYAGFVTHRAIEFRENLFLRRLEAAFRDLSEKSVIRFGEINTINATENEYSVTVTENKSRLTYFKAVAQNKASSTNSNIFINFSGAYKDWSAEDVDIVLTDGEKDTKKLILFSDISTFEPRKRNTPFYQTLAANSGVYVYDYGTKDTRSIQDIKGRIFDAIYLANENNDCNLVPFMRNSHARIKVHDGARAHDTTPVTDRITITSFTGKTITYTIVHGGRSGQKAEPTGTILRVGSQVSEGTSISSSASPAVGTVAVNIKDVATRRDVLEEIRLAINSPNGHNGEERFEAITARGVDPTAPEPQYLLLKQTGFGTGGNRPISKNGFGILTIVGFTDANDYVAKKAIKLTNPTETGTPKILGASVGYDILFPGALLEQNCYDLEDFSDPVVNIEFRDGNDQNSYYTKPNHDVEVRSFGFSHKTSDLSHFEDLSLNGPKLDVTANYKRTLDIDPVFFVKADSTVRFPVQVNNLGSVIGSEYDGTIEPFELRESMLGKTISESSFYGLKGALVGEYSYSEIRKESSIISNKINFEKSKNVAFFDNCPSLTSLIKDYNSIRTEFIDRSESIERANSFYSKLPGVIFKNESKIQPYIDTEERIFQFNPLNGNNPETNEMDLLVLTLQEMNVGLRNMIASDDENLGGENFRRKAGFDYSSSHPGTDSIVFSGLKYV